jgi:hypothetical protein
MSSVCSLPSDKRSLKTPPVKTSIHFSVRGSECVKMRQPVSCRPFSSSVILSNFVSEPSKQEFDLLNDPVVIGSNIVGVDVFEN